jgi:hypothetical protein
MAETLPQSTQAATVAAKTRLLKERTRHWREIQTLLGEEPKPEGNQKNPEYLRWLRCVADHSVCPFAYNLINQLIDPWTCRMASIMQMTVLSNWVNQL